MSQSPQIALMSALPLPSSPEAEAPDWIHLLPAGPLVQTNDARGPYRIEDVAALIAASLAAGVKLPIDENHAIDLAAPRGEPAPARGYITQLQQRADGVWGRADWTAAGRALMADRAYCGISPAIAHDSRGRVLAILRASLVNRPNLRGLTALHQEDNMSLTTRLAALLGAPADIDDDALVERVTALHQQPAPPPEAVALQSQLAQIGVALGVAQDAPASDVLTAARRAAGGDTAAITALQSELATVTTAFNSMTETHAREKAVAWVDGEIRRGRVGIKPRRDYYIGLHMRDAAEAVSVVEALPVMAPGVQMTAPPVQVALHSEDPSTYVAAARAYQKKLADGGVEIDFPSAVTAVREGKQ